MKRTRRLRWAFRLLFALAATAAIWSFFIEPGRLLFPKSELVVPHWSTRGLTIAVLADLHAGAPHISLERVKEIVELTHRERPDLILFPGDLVIGGVLGGEVVDPEPLAAVLGKLRAPLGVYAVLGNHDWVVDGPRIIAALEKEGIEVLENEAFHIDADGRALWILGISDLWTRTPEIEATLATVTNADPIIAFTHNPDLFPTMPERVSLTIAGHTHGGQVRLPFIGAPVVPSKFAQRYVKGHIVEEGRHIFVSTGIGTSILPVRFGVAPEIPILSITSTITSRMTSRMTQDASR